MVPQNFIEKLSVGSKNSSKVGYEAEQFVLLDHSKRNCSIISERLCTPFAEVDILFRSAKGQVVLLEVKTLSKWAWIETRLGSKQISRLKRASQFVEGRLGESVQICAAFVMKDKIIYLNVD